MGGLLLGKVEDAFEQPKVRLLTSNDAIRELSNDVQQPNGSGADARNYSGCSDGPGPPAVSMGGSSRGRRGSRCRQFNSIDGTLATANNRKSLFSNLSIVAACPAYSLLTYCVTVQIGSHTAICFSSFLASNDSRPSWIPRLNNFLDHLPPSFLHLILQPQRSFTVTS